MSRVHTTSSFTTEFGSEVEADRQAWLRRRFLWYAGLQGVFAIMGLLLLLTGSNSDSIGMRARWVSGGLNLVALIAFGWAFVHVWRDRLPRFQPLKLVYWLVVSMGLMTVLAMPALSTTMPDGSVRGPGVRIGPSTPKSAEPVLVPPGPVATPERPAASPSAPAAGERANQEATPGDARDPASRGARPSSAILGGMMGAWAIFVTHFFACVILPWTPQESIRPIIPLIGANAVMTGGLAVSAAAHGSGVWNVTLQAIIVILVSLLVPLPGLGVCAWRHGRFRRRKTFDILRGRWRDVSRELVDARRIHESLFPKPAWVGPLRFDYAYEPMRQIGGDYLFAERATGPNGSDVFNLVLMDVTGHGIPAALTVNRLYGELKRIFAENPGASPGVVLRLLNSYVHLTLSSHAVFVTAMCLRIDCRADTLEYASGGHPPAFLRCSDGTIDRLDSTTFVLGVVLGEEFDPEPRTLRFGAGDCLIAYTDGAIEARGRGGRYLGVAGMQRIVAGSVGDKGWPETILRAVDQHRHGPSCDDTLVIELYRATRDRPSGDTTEERRVAPIGSDTQSFTADYSTKQEAR